MSTNPQFAPTNLKEWENRHHTFKQGIDNLFDAINGDTGDVIADYNNMTVSIQQKIGEAIQSNKRLKVLGGGWSFTKIATTDGWMVDSKQLNMTANVSAASIAQNYKGDKSQLLFAQCGNSVKELNDLLRKKNRALKTCGASNGQTIIGAISTGTHGAAIDFGATQDYVVGLHIITSPDRHIWLERASYPVVADTFINRLHTELVRDDDLFNSALVSFGSFGFIHGVMLETEPLYLLETYRKLVPLDSLKNIMNTLDFSNVQFTPHTGERPFHFQWVLNPHDIEAGVYVTLMYKRPYKDDYIAPAHDENKAGPGDDAPIFIGRITDLFPALTATIVNQLFKSSYAPFDNVLGTCGEIFYNTDTRGKVASAAIGISAGSVSKVNELLIDLNKREGPFVGVYSYRYVKATKATLGFTTFDHTCIVEFDAVDSAGTKNFYNKLWQALDDHNIAYTFHWGKLNNMDAFKIKKMYGAKVDKWLKARNTLLPPSSVKAFNNEILEEWGLDK
ncbi:MAG: FAD-binding protein [Segetibacter sp.]|nr:FAD-binding protein [Segetibacter sp.]